MNARSMAGTVTLLLCAVFAMATAACSKAPGSASNADDPAYNKKMTDVGALIDEGGQQANQGHFAAAATILEKAVAQSEQDLGEGPYTSLALTNLGFAYANLGRYNDAEVAYKHAQSIIEKLYGPDNRKDAQVLTDLGMLYANTGRSKAAEPLLQRAVDICSKPPATEDRDLAFALHALGQLYMNTGRTAQGAPLLKRANAIMAKLSA